jgi:hypothetical protein
MGARASRGGRPRHLERGREPDDATFLEDTLEELITYETLGEAFCAEPLDDHVARLCLDLDLSTEAAERWRDLPDPPDGAGVPPEDPDEAPGRRSSA